jgi:hypothetical protein
LRSGYTALLVASLIVILSSPVFLVSNGGMAATDNPDLVQEASSSLAGEVVLFDEAHTAGGSSLMTVGNTSLMAWILEENGYQADMNFDQHIDSGILTGVDIFVLMFPMVALTAGEVTALHDFVTAGGGLLLIGTDYSTTWGFNSTNLNPVSEEYGITFNLDAWLGSTIDLTAHQLTQDVSSIHVNYDYKLRACSMTVESPATVIASGAGNPIVAVAEAGAGRVVAVSAAAPFTMYRTLLTWQTEDDDLFQFTLNIADWLVGNSPRKVVVPDTAVITLGSGPSLTPSEYDSYEPYVGMIHEHSTHSDGQSTVEEDVWAGLTRGLDFMILTDHSYEIEPASGRGGITGALEARSYCQEHQLGVEQFIGAELSRGHHTTGFPLTENIYTDSQQEMVLGIHAQGGIAMLCHPTIAAQYQDTYVKMEEYGYDGIEVDNSGYIHGILDEGYNWPFYGASDYHLADDIGRVLNAVFVNSTSGPDGRLSAADVVDAILNKRVVIIDHDNDMIYGQKVWVDKYLESVDEAEDALTAAQSAVGALPSDIEGTSLAELYLRDAELAFDYGCVGKTIQAATSAASTEASQIWINPIASDPRVIDPSESFTITLNVTNLGAASVQFNSSAFRSLGSNLNDVSEVVSVGADSSYLWEKDGESSEQGLVLLAINLMEFDKENLTSVYYAVGGLIDANPTVLADESMVTISLLLNRGDFRFLKNATIIYDDGSGLQTASASIKATTIDFTLGPYTQSTNITYHFLVCDKYGGRFELSEHTYTAAATTTGGGGGTPLSPLILVGAIGGTVAVIAIVVFLGRRRGA